MGLSIADPVFGSVLIVTQDRPKQLQECLESVLRASHPFPMEIVLVLNGEDQVAADLRATGITLKVVRSPRGTPAAARNYGLQAVRGEYVCFLDDDVAIPADYFEKAARIFAENPGLAILGGPDRTFEGAGALEMSIGLALKSPLATGRTRLRHGGGAALTRNAAGEESLILCNLWIRSELFLKRGFRFDEEFRRNEENVLIHAIATRSSLYDPALFVFHRRKSDPRRLMKAVFQSGWFRAKSFVRYPGSGAPTYALPVLFDAYLLSLFFLGAPRAPIVLYALVAISAALAVSFRAKRPSLWGIVATYQLLIPVAYGVGFASGIGNEFLALGRSILAGERSISR